MSLKKYIPTLEKVESVLFVYQFTILVPVYNGSQTLHRVFESLNAQTFRDFEVIIINDGSNDNTHEVITSFLPSSTFEVTYINNALNKHKLGCIMEAVHCAKGEFFLILDCDDEFMPNALEVFFNEYRDIPDDIKDRIAGVTGCCVNQNGALVGDYFPEDPFYKTSFERNVYYQIKGEKCGFNKTNILKSIIIDEEVFGKGLIPESYIWFLIASKGYSTKYINKILRIYYIEPQTSLSKLGYEKKAFGMAIFAIAFMNWFHKKHLFKATKYFLMRLYSLLKAAKYLEYKLGNYTGAIDNYFLKGLFILIWPFRRLL